MHAPPSLRRLHSLAPLLLLAGTLPGCIMTGCYEDADVTVGPWEGTPGMGVTWEELGEDVSSFPRIEDLLGQAALAGNATGEVPVKELDAFEAAMDRSWEDSGRPGARPRDGDQNLVRYQGREWNVTGHGVCV